MSKLTEDEHHARAMLMGRTYLPWANAYRANKTDELIWLDADTMKPLDLDDISLRIQQTLDSNPESDLGIDWGTRNGE